MPVVAPEPLFPDEAGAAAEPWLARLPAGFLALHPGSGSPRKNWPADRFAALARDLARGAPWLLVHGPADAGPAAVLRSVEGAVEAAHLPLRVLARVLSAAGVHVGNDSGASHLAAAAGAPTLALFGPTDPALWAPVGRRVRVLRGDGGRLEGLAVPEVAAAARETAAA